METIEAFCAEHTVSVEDILYEIPASQFEAMYDAYSKRKIAEELSERRSMMLSALWGNSNYDPQRDANGQQINTDAREKLSASLDESFSKTIASLYGEERLDVPVEYDEDNPFFAAMKRGIAKYGIDDGDNLKDSIS